MDGRKLLGLLGIGVLAVAGGVLAETPLPRGLDPGTCAYVKKLMARPPEEGWYLGPEERKCLLYYLNQSPNREHYLKAKSEKSSKETEARPAAKTAEEKARPSGPPPAEPKPRKQPRLAKTEPKKTEPEKTKPAKTSEPQRAESAGRSPGKPARTPKKTAGVSERKPEPRSSVRTARKPTPGTKTPPSQSVSRPQVELALKPGYLSENLARILNEHGWKTPPGWWDSPRDYLIVSEFSVKGESFMEALRRLLKPYRLKAQLYTWDRSVRVRSVVSGD